MSMENEYLRAAFYDALEKIAAAEADLQERKRRRNIRGALAVAGGAGLGAIGGGAVYRRGMENMYDFLLRRSASEASEYLAEANKAQAGLRQATDRLQRLKAQAGSKPSSSHWRRIYEAEQDVRDFSQDLEYAKEMHDHASESFKRYKASMPEDVRDSTIGGAIAGGAIAGTGTAIPVGAYNMYKSYKDRKNLGPR